MTNRDAAEPVLNLQIFGGPVVIAGGQRHKIPECCERLVVWLAIKGTKVDRSVAASMLWPEVVDRRAAGESGRLRPAAASPPPGGEGRPP